MEKLAIGNAGQIMIGILLFAQIVTHDSVYSSPALRALVLEASVANRAVPPGLLSYRAAVGSEISLVIQPPDGPEAIGQIEQIENVVSWLRTGAYEQRIIGYRVQAAGFGLSALSYVSEAWTIPVLYGNKLSLFFGSRDTTGHARRPPPKKRRAPIIAVHPFAADRDAVYRFTGGDTVAVIRLRDRTLAIRRIRVEPRENPGRRLTVFSGEVDVDADRKQIVRMRGRFVEVGVKQSVGGRLLRGAVTAVAYVELVNAEVDGQYWLPSYQRVEGQVASAVTGDARSIFRMISQFRDYKVNDVPVSVEVGSPADTLRLETHRLTRLPDDSLASYQGWTNQAGATSAEARGTDFDDLAPDQWRSGGPPRLDLRVNHFSDIVRFNRVEGWYTGYGASIRFRDATPGLSVRAHGGWAWSEQTAKGAVRAEWRKKRFIFAVDGQRLLANTNDFLPSFDPGATIPAVLASVDNYDYVDRRVARASVRALIGDPRTPVMLGDFTIGTGSDRNELRRVNQGLFGDGRFLDNRSVSEGRYRLSALQLELRPDVSGEFVTPGAGAMVRYERGDGELQWQRLEGRLVARRNGRVTLAARGDAGMLLGGDYPLQQLFELGGTTGLPGYAYKEFAGDRAVLVRTLAMVSIPVFRTPVKITRRLYLPAPSPAFAVGVQSGWTGVSDERAAEAVNSLGVRRDRRNGAVILDGTGGAIAVSRPTIRARSSVDAGIRLFGGAIGLALARPIDHGGGWQVVLSSSSWN
jgi:hypothetical protein